MLNAGFTRPQELAGVLTLVVLLDSSRTLTTA